MPPYSRAPLPRHPTPEALPLDPRIVHKPPVTSYPHMVAVANPYRVLEHLWRHIKGAANHLRVRRRLQAFGEAKVDQLQGTGAGIA